MASEVVFYVFIFLPALGLLIHMIGAEHIMPEWYWRLRLYERGNEYGEWLLRHRVGFKRAGIAYLAMLAGAFYVSPKIGGIMMMLTVSPGLAAFLVLFFIGLVGPRPQK